MTAKTPAERNASYRRRMAEKMERMENALAEIARRGALCIHQNIGRWDMSLEHDKRSHDIIATNNRIALEALNPTP